MNTLILEEIANTSDKIAAFEIRIMAKKLDDGSIGMADVEDVIDGISTRHSKRNAKLIDKYNEICNCDGVTKLVINEIHRDTEETLMSLS